MTGLFWHKRYISFYTLTIFTHPATNAVAF